MVIHAWLNLYRVIHGYTVTMVLEGYTWLYLVIESYRGLYMVIEGYTWLYVVIHGYRGLYMVIGGYTGLYM